MASAATDGRRRAFEDLLHCMICFDAYRSPKMLHCGHTFCAECLIGYHRTYQQQRRSVQGKLPCPTCRELTTLPQNGITGLKNDFKVKKIEEMFKTVNIKSRVSSMVCDPCKAEKKSSAASSYCPNCTMNYCTGCLKKHGKNPVFKNHQVITNRGDNAHMVCRVHSDEQGRYFCKTCQMVVCTICIVQGHDGHNVSEIDALFKQQQQDIQNLKNVVETRLGKLQRKVSELEDLKQVNLTSSQQAERDIREKTKQLMSSLRQQEHDLLNELKQKRDAKVQQIEEELERAQFHVTKSVNLSEYATTTMSRSSLHMIAVHEEFIQRMRTVAESNAHLPDNQILTVISFLPGRHETSIGRIDEARAGPDQLKRQATAQPLQSPIRQISLDHATRPELVLHINRFGTKPGEVRDPLGVACLLNGDIVVTEWGNKRVQLFNSSGKSVDIIGQGQLQAPQGVAVTLKGNIIVTDGQQKRLQVFSPSGSSLAKWGLGKFFTPCGIAISPNGNCVVSDAGEHSVSIFQGERTCLKRFGSEGNADTKFKNPLYVTTGQHNEVIVSDSDNHCVKLFDSSGRFRGKFGGQGGKDGQLHFPRGICSDQEGNIVVADRNNHRVSLFTSKGRFLRHLLNKEDGIRDPYAVTLSITGSLVITESSNNRASIKVFKL